jgi:Flp pilus assembly protein TadG
MKPHRRTAGAAMVELVVIAPLLLLVLLGLIQAGGAGDFAIVIANAARAGVQYGAQNHTTAADATGMQTAATNDADTAGVSAVGSYFCQCEDLTASTCGLAGACSTNHQNLFVQVVVTGTMASLVNYSLLPAGLRTITITRTATMPVTQ